MNIVLMSATGADGAAIGAILSGWIDETDWMPRMHSIEQDLQHGCFLVAVCEVTVARQNGEVIGFLARQGSDIQALYLKHDARGAGVGQNLLDQAKRQVGCLVLWSFQANGAALRFYKKHGFIEDQRTNGTGNDEGLPDVHMIWERDAA